MDSDERAIAPEEAFSLLGNDTRIGIVRALWEADEPLSFSELHDRVGLRDSGQFNYHLNKLVGLFVRQKNGKYELPFAGHRVTGAILSGTYTHTGYPRRSNSIHGVSSVAGRWRPNTRRRWSRFAVPSCDERRSTFGFPPGAFEGRNVEDLPRTFERWLRNAFSVMADGICPNCSGRTVGSLAATPLKRFSLAGLSVAGFAFGGVVWLAAVAVGWFPATVGLFFVAWIPVGATNVIFAAMIQSVVPEDFMGRVASVNASASAGAMPIGALLGGIAGDAVGSGVVVTSAGFGFIFLSLYWLAHPLLRGLSAVEDIEGERYGLARPT
jgi:hypothetical protein